jgi:hypothetical protein
MPGAQVIAGLGMQIYHCTKDNDAQLWWHGPGVNPD